MDADDLKYVGFWPRVLATLIDTVLIWMVTVPLLLLIYGNEYWSTPELVKGPADFLLSWVFPMVAVIFFWVFKQATPGKMALSARIVDARTGNPASPGQYAVRYFGYFLSTLPLFLGIIWVAIDDRKRGWHDLIAGTVVVGPKVGGPRPVKFD